MGLEARARSLARSKATQDVRPTREEQGPPKRSTSRTGGSHARDLDRRRSLWR